MTTPKIFPDSAKDKQTGQSRADRAEVIAGMAPTSPLYLSQPEVKAAADALVSAGTDLAGALTAQNKADTQAANARDAVVEKTAAYDSAYSVFTAVLRKYAKSPADVTTLGMGTRQPVNNTLAMPIAVEAKFNVLKSAISIYIQRAPGMLTVAVEISHDPTNPASWTRLKGTGARRTVTGYTPGTYYVRAASLTAQDQSDFTDPVPVTVK
jgi:hypothetical protein